MTKEMWIEANREALENTYNTMYMDCIKEGDAEMWEALHKYEDALVALGILEADEEPEEDLNTSTNWDEWEIDRMIDHYMEDRMAYEV